MSEHSNAAVIAMMKVWNMLMNSRQNDTTLFHRRGRKGRTKRFAILQRRKSRNRNAMAKASRRINFALAKSRQA